MKRTVQLLGTHLISAVALGLLAAPASAAPNNVKFRNCTSKILHLESYNSWDKDLTFVYPGEGSALIPQRNSAIAKNHGEGETGQVGCNDWWLFKSYNTCKVRISCSTNTPCEAVLRNFEEGSWVYYKPSDIRKGDTCQFFTD